jgi:Bax protein
MRAETTIMRLLTGTSMNLISGAIGVVRSLLAKFFLATHPHKWVNRGALTLSILMVATLVAPPALAQPAFVTMRPSTTAALWARYEALRQPLHFPARRESRFAPVVLETLPADYHDSMPVAERKALFMAILMPKILLINNEINADRQFLENVTDTLNAEQAARLDALIQRYGTDDPQELLTRVDTIPPSLVVAQAVLEAGWGRSRLARSSNALFGMKSGRHSDRVAFGRCRQDAAECYRSFDSLTDSVGAYIHTLNTHSRYAGLRVRRAESRAAGRAPASLELATELQAFSVRGAAYVTDVQRLITSNKLENLDSATLAELPDGEMDTAL